MRVLQVLWCNLSLAAMSICLATQCRRTNLAAAKHSRVPPDVGLAPNAAWRALPVHPLRLEPLPTSLGRPLPEHCKKSQGLGRRGRARVGREGLWRAREGREGLWLEGRVLLLAMGGWGPSKEQLGPSLYLGLSTFTFLFEATMLPDSIDV